MYVVLTFHFCDTSVPFYALQFESDEETFILAYYADRAAALAECIRVNKEIGATD